MDVQNSGQSRKQDDKTKKEAEGKSHVESVIGYRDLNAEFEDCSDNSSNEVNAAGSIVPTVRQNSLNIVSATGSILILFEIEGENVKKRVRRIYDMARSRVIRRLEYLKMKMKIKMKNKIKGLIWVNNYIAIKKEKSRHM
nr:hypothetical protein [Tanacetum cinerariifolium]